MASSDAIFMVLRAHYKRPATPGAQAIDSRHATALSRCIGLKELPESDVLGGSSGLCLLAFAIAALSWLFLHI